MVLVFTVAAQQSLTGCGVVVAVAVALHVSRGVAVYIDLGPSRSWTLGGGTCIATATGAAGAPAVPHVIALGAVMDEDEEAESDGEGTVQTAEDHVQEVPLRHGQRPKRPRGQEQEEGEGGGSQLCLE